MIRDDALPTVVTEWTVELRGELGVLGEHHRFDPLPEFMARNRLEWWRTHRPDVESQILTRTKTVTPGPWSNAGPAREGVLTIKFILDGAREVINAQLGSFRFLQRRLRVTEATANRVFQAMEVIGVLGTVHVVSDSGREVLHRTFDADAITALIKDAALSGRIRLDDLAR